VEILYYSPPFFFYIIYAYGIVHFILSPALQNSYPTSTVFLNGAFFGFVAYAAYDLTNHATLNDWPMVITVIDLAWGTFMTGLASMLSYIITQITG
jgi:uncharacterized membrane protein